MNKIKVPIQATEFRINLNDYFKISLTEPVLVTSARSGSRVFLSLDDYNKLVEIYENYKDSEILKERIKKDSGDYIPIEKVINENFIGKNGLKGTKKNRGNK